MFIEHIDKLRVLISRGKIKWEEGLHCIYARSNLNFMHIYPIMNPYDIVGKLNLVVNDVQIISKVVGTILAILVIPSLYTGKVREKETFEILKKTQCSRAKVESGT